MFLFGAPLVWLFVRKRWVAWWQSVLGGVLAASFFLILWFATSSWEHFLLNGLNLTLYAWATAAAVGLIFWLIGLWRNPRFHGPNNSFKPTPLRGAA